MTDADRADMIRKFVTYSDLQEEMDALTEKVMRRQDDTSNRILDQVRTSLVIEGGAGDFDVDAVHLSAAVGWRAQLVRAE